MRCPTCQLDEVPPQPGRRYCSVVCRRRAQYEQTRLRGQAHIQAEQQQKEQAA